MLCHQKYLKWLFTVAAKAKKLNVFKPKESNVNKASDETYQAESNNVDSTGRSINYQ